MSAIYGIGGCLLVALGLWDGVRIIHKLLNEGTGVLGSKIKLLCADILSIILGIALIVYY
jgi:hypothetical protein